jgi:hypothetical protein
VVRSSFSIEDTFFLCTFDINKPTPVPCDDTNFVNSLGNILMPRQVRNMRIYHAPCKGSISSLIVDISFRYEFIITYGTNVLGEPVDEFRQVYVAVAPP